MDGNPQGIRGLPKTASQGEPHRLLVIEDGQPIENSNAAQGFATYFTVFESDGGWCDEHELGITAITTGEINRLALPHTGTHSVKRAGSKIASAKIVYLMPDLPGVRLGSRAFGVSGSFVQYGPA